MIRNNRQYSWLAAVGATLVAVAALTACSSSPSSSTPAASPTASTGGGNYAAEVAQFGSCVAQHGVSVSGTPNAKSLRTALAEAPKSQRHAALTACKHDLGSLASEFGSLGGS